MNDTRQTTLEDRVQDLEKEVNKMGIENKELYIQAAPPLL